MLILENHSMKKIVLVFILSSGFLSVLAQSNWQQFIDQLDTVKKGTPTEAEIYVSICWEMTEYSPDSALYYCELGEQSALALENDSILTRAYLGNSVALSYKGMHADAIQKSFEALKLAESRNDTLSMADAVNNIGIDLYYQGEFEEAIKYYRLYAQYSQATNNQKQYANALNNIATIESETGNKEKEVALYREAIAVFQQIEDGEGIANTSLNLAITLTESENYDQAHLYYQNSYAYFNENDLTAAKSESLTFWGESLYRAGRYQQALQKCRQSLAISVPSNIELQQMFAYDLLHKVFSKLGRYDSAYYYQGKHQEMYNRERDTEKAKLVQELKVAYETEQKEQEIAQLEQDNKLKEFESSRRRQYQIFLGVTSVLLIMAVGLLYSRSQIKSKVNKELAASNHAKDRLFSVISHDLKSPISSFNTITTNLTNHWDHVDKDQLKKYVETLRDSSREVQDMMDNLMRWALSQTGGLNCKKQKINLNHLLHDVTSQLNTAIHQKKLSIRNQLTGSEKVYADEGFLKIVLRNLVDNAIKYTPEGKSITIDYKTAGTSDFIEITDEGVGISAENAPKLFDPDTLLDIQNSVRRGTGIGLKLCKELMDKMGGSVSVRSELGKGSTFILELKKY